jgi:hypothetical protein
MRRTGVSILLLLLSLVATLIFVPVEGFYAVELHLAVVVRSLRQLARPKRSGKLEAAKVEAIKELLHRRAEVKKVAMA